MTGSAPHATLRRCSCAKEACAIPAGTSGRPRGNGRAGFTLMEILLALFLFSMVVAILSGALDRIFGDTDALAARQQLDQSAASCLEVMVTDLQSIYRPETRPSKPTEASAAETGLVFGGEGFDDEFRLAFTAFDHYPTTPADFPGIARITYYTSPESDHGQSFRLMRAARRFQDTPFEKNMVDPVLCRRLSAVEMTLIDAEGREHDRWGRDAGTDAGHLPRSIRIAIELSRQGRTDTYQTQVLLPGGR